MVMYSHYIKGVFLIVAMGAIVSCQSDEMKYSITASNSFEEAYLEHKLLEDSEKLCFYIAGGLEYTHELKTASKKVKKLNSIWAERAIVNNCEKTKFAEKIAKEKLMAGNLVWQAKSEESEKELAKIKRHKEKKIAMKPLFRNCSIGAVTVTDNEKSALTFECENKNDESVVLDELSFKHSKAYKALNPYNREAKEEWLRKYGKRGDISLPVFSEDTIKDGLDSVIIRRNFDNCSNPQANVYDCKDQFGSRYILKIKKGRP